MISGFRRLLTVAAASMLALVPTAGVAAQRGFTVTAADWHACQDGLQCATVAVPLDYRDPTGATISVVLMRHRATDPAHRLGTLFFNSGGPYEQLTSFPRYLGLLPAAWRARYDVINFDLRGFGYSTSVRCFPSEAAESAFLSGLPADVPVTAGQVSTWETIMARYSAICARTNGALLQHTSTADVARDMNLLRQAVGAPMLNYVAGSYGTGLGAIYANLFPAKVGRMILDGNLDPIAWTSGDPTLPPFGRMRADVASARTLDGFLDLCGQARTDKYAFSAGTPAATRAKFTTLIDRLHGHPVTAGTQTCDDVCATYSVPLAQVDQWTAGAAFLQQLWQATTGQTAIGQPAEKRGVSASLPYVGGEQSIATICSDANHPRDPRDYPAAARMSYARAGLVGLSWTWTTEICASWPRSADSYTGPWNRHTANPILLVGNTGDPNTPYWSSVAMSHDLAGARLLTVDGFGHTEFLNPSTCAQNYETRYLRTGALPAPGAACQQDTPPFS